MVMYNSETDSLDVYENGIFIGRINGLGFKSTIKYYTHSSSGGERTLTLNENWSEITSVEIISGNNFGATLVINSFTTPNILKYTIIDGSGIAYGSYTNVLAIQGKLA